MVHVPFKGGSAALAALLANQVKRALRDLADRRTAGEGGKAQAARGRRLEALECDAGAAHHGGVGLSRFQRGELVWRIRAAGTPREIVKRLNRDIVNALNQPDVRERFASQGAELIGNTPEQHEEFLRAEMAKWARVARLADARAD